jgi:hypothetical protein
MNLIELVCSMTSIQKLEVQDVHGRSEQYELQTKGWSARLTGLRSAHARLRKRRGSHGWFTTQCEATVGGRLGAKTAPLSSSAPGHRCDASRNVSFPMLSKVTGNETMSRRRMESAPAPTARKPGRRNGSNLSLVIRAVKSDIFLNGCYNR